MVALFFAVKILGFLAAILEREFSKELVATVLIAPEKLNLESSTLSLAASRYGENVNR